MSRSSPGRTRRAKTSALAVSTGATPTPPFARTRPRVAGRVVLATVAVASIGTATFASFASGASGTDPRSSLTFIAPAGVGGGWDSFAREQQQAMRLEGIANTVQVVNIPGAAGTIGLSAFAELEDQPATILATGAVMLGGIAINDSPVALTDLRPIARLAEDYSVMVVDDDAPWSTLDELVAAWQEDPEGMRFTGGSTGSIEHLLTGQLATETGIDPTRITYIPTSGGGETIQTLTSGTADVAIAGYNEVADQIEAGRVTAFALSGPERLATSDVPTFRELGYDVALVNWRGLLAGADVSDEEFEALTEIIRETVASDAWADALERNRWLPAYLEGEDFEQFLREDQEHVADIIESLGL